MENRNVWVYDVETLASMFSYSAINIDTEEVVKYVIHKDRCDFDELIKHLKECKGHIGFNNISFDYPIIHYIMTNIDTSMSRELTINSIYKKAQKIISSQNEDDKSYNYIADKDVLIPQLDLFKLNHFDNKAKRCSLKNVQIAINYPNVQDMPIEHTCKDITLEQVDEILDYNINDILSTFEFYKKCIDKIELRKSIGKLYKLPLINKSDSAIGIEILKKEYCQKANVQFSEIKDLKSQYYNLRFEKIISPLVKFESKQLNDFLTKLKNNTFNQFSDETIIFNNTKYIFAKGGLHSYNKPTIYEPKVNTKLIDFDFGSYYPGLMLTLGVFPKHLSRVFLEVVKSLTERRLKAKQEGDKVTTDSLKLTINSIFGNLNNQYSWICDTQALYTVTINGQLFLLMLIEQLAKEGIYCFYANTDGITCIVDDNKIDTYNTICNNMSTYLNIPVEFQEYTKCIIRDCNNYIIKTSTGKSKLKGVFVYNKEIYQDNSFKIIPITLEKYFIDGIPVQETIKNHTNIYDFCGRQKFTKDSYGEIHSIKYDNNLPIRVVEKQQKNVRYYISTNGNTFIKQYLKGSEELIHKGFKVTVFNKYEELEDYKIDYKFYIKECNKIIELLEDKQMDLFNLIEEIENE
jgi:hypothetical protein